MIGIDRKQAPSLRVPYWIDGKGKERSPLNLQELGNGYKVLYCFQYWCPGCHSSGFPTLVYLHEKLTNRGVGFAVIQTVFEGAEQNTQDKIVEMQQRTGLAVPFGHDPIQEGERYPTIMEDYRTGGTPWFIVISPENEVIYNDFRLDGEQLVQALIRQ